MGLILLRIATLSFRVLFIVVYGYCFAHQPLLLGPGGSMRIDNRKQRRGQIPKRPAAWRLRSSVGSCWHAKYGVARASPRSFIVSQAPCHPPLPNISGHFAYLPLSPLTTCHHASPALIDPHCFLVPFCPFRPWSHCPLILVLPSPVPLLNLLPLVTSRSFCPRIPFCRGVRGALGGSPVSACKLFLCGQKKHILL